MPCGVWPVQNGGQAIRIASRMDPRQNPGRCKRGLQPVIHGRGGSGQPCQLIRNGQGLCSHGGQFLAHTHPLEPPVRIAGVGCKRDIFMPTDCHQMIMRHRQERAQHRHPLTQTKRADPSKTPKPGATLQPHADRFQLIIGMVTGQQNRIIGKRGGTQQIIPLCTRPCLQARSWRRSGECLNLGGDAASDQSGCRSGSFLRGIRPQTMINDDGTVPTAMKPGKPLSQQRQRHAVSPARYGTDQPSLVGRLRQPRQARQQSR